jgi:hypothetical protein
MSKPSPARFPCLSPACNSSAAASSRSQRVRGLPHPAARSIPSVRSRRYPQRGSSTNIRGSILSIEVLKEVPHLTNTLVNRSCKNRRTVSHDGRGILSATAYCHPILARVRCTPLSGFFLFLSFSTDKFGPAVLESTSLRITGPRLARADECEGPL